MPTSTPHTLSLPEIASWQFPKLLEALKQGKQEKINTPQMIAAIPSLQRGAVWKPGQVEMLWDSILRGFPIGSLVVCPKFEGQNFHSGKHGQGWKDQEAVSHYLLDGQQRCNAIALGFLDALVGQPSATLWIDLNPQIPKHSTRRFVLRVLTTSHPWGYGLEDDAAFIGVGAVRDALKKYACGKRPVITSAWPTSSKCTVPFSWLTAAIFDKYGEANFWQKILEQCELYASKTRPCQTHDQKTVPVHPWADDAKTYIEDHLKSPQPTSHLSHIEAALHRAQQFRLVALEVPQEILKQEGVQEAAQEASLAEGDQRIHNVEHLFQRLNSAGTELRGEELLFSLIKAYWPGIEKSFAGIRDVHGNAFLPMPGSRLASLSVRAALMSLQDKPEMQASLKIPQIRSLAFDEKNREQRDLIKKYLGIPVQDGNLSEVVASDSDLHQNLKQVDDWLLFDKAENDIGLPPVLRSSLAQGAPDVYLLLLHLAQRARTEKLGADALISLRKPVLGLATALHWFGIKQEVAVQSVFVELNNRPLLPQSFAGLLGCRGEQEVLKILSHAELESIIAPMDVNDPQLPDWTLQAKLKIERAALVHTPNSEAAFWYFVNRVIHSRPLLLYAQRRYLCNSSVFVGYDPSCVDIWRGHDRPWDFDHILPSAVIYRKHHQRFKRACSQWTGTIGNLRAWPLEKNRSKSDETAISTIKTQEDRDDSFIKDEVECGAFSIREADIDCADKAARFMNAARERMLRIYEEWFVKLEINRLLSPNS
ncbi:MAG: DUF262 domain-containing protein [Prosthecobacter sp.]|uniref:DUF262 domain-containing protein n=1 Tax=Prosthecobacter sp. TaxID=1965333 RepID=UPI0025D7365C|nr:DUF262 domain-containing protein [Prosthecobacter sp.]MCF7787060.1 DUF262 domain-containing protein [Prosthecobacter sp.]